MVFKNLKDLYNVDTISKDKGWVKVHQAVNDIINSSGDDVEIDFSSTNVVDPWDCPEFTNILRNKRIHMKFTNNEDLVKHIKMMCIMDGIDSSRISNVEVYIPKEKTPEERKIEKFGKQLLNYFHTSEDGVVKFRVSDRYDQIQSTNTLEYIKFAIEYIHKTTGANNFYIDAGKLVILDHVLEAIANIMVELDSKGIKLTINTDNNDMYNGMSLYIHKAKNTDYSNNERKKVILSTLKPNQCGMLIKYKKSKALDDFGREGKGEVISSRIAIFRGLKQSASGEAVAVIESYNNNYFYTPDHWRIEHDYEELSGLKSDIDEIPLNDLGVCNAFLGRKYHFLLPIQHSYSENVTVIERLDEDGRNVKKVCTIPERMKIVFDAWNIKYNKELLDKSIEDTKKYLEEHK